MSETVYISGPMTGYVDFNRPAFHLAERRLRNMGFGDIVNPAALDDADESDNLPHSYYMRRDIEAMLDCDAIYLLPGWRYSKGAQVEHKVAEAIGLREIVDPNPAAWACLEGEPVCGHVQHAAKIDETFACELASGHQDVHQGNGAWWVGDLPAERAETPAPAPAETEDLSDHPRFGDLFAPDEVGYIVDDSLPRDTLRFEIGGLSVDYRVTWDDDGGMRLSPKTPLDTAHNEGVRA